MDGSLFLHILLVIIFVLAILICRMYCRKRNKHKGLRFIIAGINPVRVTPVLQSTETRRTTMSDLNQQGFSIGYLPNSNIPDSLQVTTPSTIINEISDQDQISLESHTIEADENNFRTDDDVKSPPPPYSADLPTYEEAIRWSQAKAAETINNNNNNANTT